MIRLGLAAVAAAVLGAGSAASGIGAERPATAASAEVAPAAHVPKPHIVWRRIPFGKRRRHEMAAYARRHYGVREYRLVDPHVIVEHYTGSQTFSSAYNTFAPDRADPELHELPGVCSHFVIDKDGTIYQLVSLDLMCRHTVGLNYTAIGIEHVGTSDGQILRNGRQLHSSLLLTRWLRCRYGIFVHDVIGHNESLRSPYHHERVARLRNQTHGDWVRADMKTYRRKLAALHGC